MAAGVVFPPAVFSSAAASVRHTWYRLMRTFGRQAAYVVTHPGAFTLCVLRAFRANQGLLLAGAVAYYTLLSIVPLLILMRSRCRRSSTRASCSPRWDDIWSG